MTTDTCTTEEAQLAQWNYEARFEDVVWDIINSVLPTVDVDDLVARQLAPDKAARPLQKAETAS